jgi:two-component system, chemotaxis family, chemotaxis protein CheY
MEMTDLKALIVDDAKMIRALLCLTLKKLGITQIVEAENGEVALELCRKEMPNFIILDWNMPVMNGLAFLKALHQEPNWQDSTVILCTTENDADHIQSALSAGASEYIMKPFDVDIIRTKLVQVGLLDADSATKARTQDS